MVGVGGPSGHGRGADRVGRHRTRHRQAAEDAQSQDHTAILHAPDHRRLRGRGARFGLASHLFGTGRGSHRRGAGHTRRRRVPQPAGGRDQRPRSADRIDRRCDRSRWRFPHRLSREPVTQPFDAIVVGAGQAGPPLAGRLTDAGLTVAVVERKHVGGTCVNTGCIPTKTLVASAHAARTARRGAEYGVATGSVAVDMSKVKARKDGIMLADRTGVESWLEGMTGCTLIRGHARFEDPHTLRVDDELIAADRIFLNVGGRAVVPDLPGLADVDYMTNVGVLELDSLPEHLVIVGGSYIALEFAQMYRRFGAGVTVVERGSRLASREDPDVSDAIKDILEGEGIAVQLDADDVRVAPDNGGVAVTPRAGAAAIVGSHLLMAVGRKPNTDDLGLDRAGVQTDKRGYIVVDDELRTNV